MIDSAPAVRANTAIVLAFAGSSKSGKTKSALELATGLAEGVGPILVIDSEGRRALNYADQYRFHHHEWRPPYTPQALGELLQEADRREFAVTIVDSMSDEHEGEGGLADMAEAEYQEQIKKGWEPNRVAAWARPKAAHKRHVVRWLRQSRSHIIFCLRAEDKLVLEKVNKDGRMRTVPVSVGWTPICEKRLLYDVASYVLFTLDAPGVPNPKSGLFEMHKQFFPLDRQVSREAGKRLAEWAAGTSLGDGAADPSATPAPLGEALDATAALVANQGTEAFRKWFADSLSREERGRLRPFMARYQGIAYEADQLGEAAAGDGAPGDQATLPAAADE